MERGAISSLAGLSGAGLSPAHPFQVEVALRSATGLRPDPIPAPLKTFPRGAGQEGSACA